MYFDELLEFWNYRLVKQTLTDGYTVDYYYAVKVVGYTSKLKNKICFVGFEPIGVTANAKDWDGGVRRDLNNQIQLLHQAIELAIINFEDIHWYDKQNPDNPKWLYMDGYTKDNLESMLRNE